MSGSGPQGNGTSHLELEFANVHLDSAKPKKKRAQRAFHQDLQNTMLEADPMPESYPTNGNTQFSPLIPHGQQLLSPYPGNDYIPNNFDSNTIPQEPISIPQDMTHTNTINHDLSISEFRYANQQEYASPSHSKSFLTFVNVKPPDAATQFHSVDQGTASSKFMRSSFYQVPESEQLRASSKLPVSVTIRPFAPVLPTEESIPVIDMRRDEYPSKDSLDNGPIRCRRCRSYMNPSMQFTNSGKFVCNICQFANNIIPSDYNAMLDNQGQRTDKFVRPELHKGVYDLIVPKEYNFNQSSTSNAINHVFLIDISENSLRQNLSTVVVDSIRKTLYENDDFDENQDVENQPKFAIIAFDQRIHYYNLSPRLDNTLISICSDLDDPFVPFFDGLFVNAHESRSPIEEALNHLESLNSSDYIPDPECAFGAACRAAMLCLESVGGGKITAVLGGLPSWGPGRLVFKENKAVGRAVNAEAEKKLFIPDNQYFKLLAKDFIEKGVGLDVHVVSRAAVDLSNIGWLSSVAGGNVERFPNFVYDRDARSLTARIVNSIQKVRGFQTQLKLRSSNGLQVCQYYGTYTPPGENITSMANIDPVIPVMDEDLTITALLEYDGKLSTRLDCHFQAALLYTDTEGVRKVRVINLVLAVSERLEDVFAFADENAILTTIVRDSLSFIGKQTLGELRDSLNEKLVQIFTQYRAISEWSHNRNRTLTNKLLFPDSLKHLPQFFLAFIKSKALRVSNLTADERLENVYQLLHMPVERLVHYLYPALVELHSLSEIDGYLEQNHGFLNVPKFTELSIKNFAQSVYLLCNGIKVYIWVDPNTNLLLLQDLFGQHIQSVDMIDFESDELPELDTEISIQVRNIIKYFQNTVVGCPTLESSGIQLVKPGSTFELEFKTQLALDSLAGSILPSNGSSYADYLTNLHKSISDKLDSDKSSKKVRNSVNAVELNSEHIVQRYLHF